MNISTLPTVNAFLNTTSAILLVTGFFFIRKKAVSSHRFCMLSACGTSILFLISYLYYHAHYGVTRFPGQGLLRMTYFAILISHTILAVVIVPLIMITLYRAFRGELIKHRAIAKITLPLWLYVSVTGVAVYWMLYHIQY